MQSALGEAPQDDAVPEWSPGRGNEGQSGTYATWAGTLEVWDLDLREVVKQVPVGPEVRIALGETAHDFAVVSR